MPVFYLRLLILAGLAVLYPLALCLSGTPARAADAVPYTIGAGDEIRVTVYQESDLSGLFRPDGAGMISMPLIGGVAVGGLTTAEAETLIADKLRAGFILNPQVGVEISKYGPFFVMGEVRQPGGYRYSEGMTVLNAVAQCGGFTYRAREDKITLRRAGTERDVAPDTPLLPGDVVIVRERLF